MEWNNNNVHEKHVIVRSYYLTRKHNNNIGCNAAIESYKIIWLLRENISNANCDEVN